MYLDCQCGYNLSYTLFDFHDILNQPDSNFYLIFFGKSRIITIGSLETDCQGRSFYLPSPPIGNWDNYRICLGRVYSRLKTTNTTFFFTFMLMVVH